MTACINWLEHHLLPCPFKSITGLDCPGCGLQRSLVALLKGHLMESLQLFPALLPFIFTLLLLVLHLRVRLKKGAAYLKYSYIVTASIILVSYIARLAMQ